MIRSNKKIHFRLPVFFWYLYDFKTQSAEVKQRETRSLCGHFEFFDRAFQLGGGLFNVVFHAIEKGSLINHEDREIFEEFSEGCDGLGDFC